MKKVFLIKYGELAIKGKNRYLFENRLVTTIQRNLKQLGKFEVKKEQGRIMVEPLESCDEELVIEKISRIFGIIGVAYGTKEDEVSLDAVKRLALNHMKKECSMGPRTFKVETKRSDKRFPLNSMQVSAEINMIE